MRRSILVSVAAISFAVWGSGCATWLTAEGQKPHISLGADGSVAVEGQKTTLDGLGPALQGIGLKTDSPVLIAVDRAAQHRHVVSLLEALKELGYKNVSLKTGKAKD